ncbi:MAG TPA: DUF4293 domain-containing protein [Bacteroidales bacterium]|nr:DUF4293 domain-containing protein [Bacteroidales bacterium]
MLQRIQSVYLTLVFVFMLLIVFMPLGNFEETEPVFEAPSQTTIVPLIITGPVLPDYFHQTVEKSNLSIVLLILTFGIMALSVLAILLFKRRRYQMQLCKFNILLLVGLVVTAFSFIDHYKIYLTGMTYTHGAGIFLPLAAMVLVVLAIRAIKKDELLVRSADRIR